jgi:hypothetical protein
MRIRSKNSRASKFYDEHEVTWAFQKLVGNKIYGKILPRDASPSSPGSRKKSCYLTAFHHRCPQIATWQGRLETSHLAPQLSNIHVHPLTGASDMHLRLCLLGANDRPSSSPHKHRKEIVLLGTSPHLLLPEVARSLEALHGDPQPDINH